MTETSDNKAKVFAMMADAAPIAKNLVEVLEAKGVPPQIWMVAMGISMLSIEIDGKPITSEFINTIIKSIYGIQQEVINETTKIGDSEDKSLS